MTISDLIVNVRQIGNYPVRTASDGTETILAQVGGLGGPYQTLQAQTLVSTALNGASLGVGSAIPAYAEPGNVFLGAGVLPQSGAILWNAYRANGGILRTWKAGMAGMVDWQPGSAGWRFSVAPSGAPGAPIDRFIPLVELNTAGALKLPAGTLTVARDPSAPLEVATRRWVQNSTVANFNGRTGAVRLQEQDVYKALGLKSEIATNDSVIARIQELLAGHPFVWSWNGRTGSIWLTTEDVNRAFLCDGVWPLSRTPPAGDRSDKIANTRWVVDFAYGPFWKNVEQALQDKVGPEGPEGPAGPQGPPGTGFNFRGMIPTAADLPATGNEQGDLFITQDTQTGYVWDDAAGVWQQLGIITPSARVFVADTAPLVADQGDLWWNSITGELFVYFQGASGGQWVIANTAGEGAQGPPGPQGTPGLPGPNVWIGTSPPPSPTAGRLWYDPGSASTAIFDGTQWLPVSEPGATVSVGATPPATPKDGDLWFDSNTGDLMLWFVGPSGSQWVSASSADPGPQGPPGPAGPVGPAGPQGVRGEPGQGINLLGSVTTFGALPTTGQQNGDAWVTQDTNQLWVWDGSAWELIGVGGGIGEAPTDGRIYGRQNLDWEPLMDDGAY